MTDIRIDDNGSILILTPESETGKEWCREHLDPDAIGWGPKGYVVEPRYILAIVEGAIGDGLEVTG